MGTNGSCEHPPYLPAVGATVIHQLLDGLASNPKVWNKTVFFLNYDENDGFFDHVPPPTSPEGTAGEWLTVPAFPAGADGGILGPIGLGFRVPAFVISPWSIGGWRASQVYDHTSTIRFMEQVFGVENTNLSQWRRENVGDFTQALNLKHKKKASIPALPFNLVIDQCVNSQDQNAPVVPAAQTLPTQEPGTRPQID